MHTGADGLDVTAVSGNTALLPKSGITISGSGENRALTLTPGTNQIGTTVVTVTVNDGLNTTVETFNAEWWNALNVPSEYGTIQQAIDAAGNGDTVVVADGNYKGAGNKNINFSGTGSTTVPKAITVRSENGPESTIIDCEGVGRGVVFQSNEEPSSKLDGFTIKNGNETYGGAIHISSSSPAISNCIFQKNHAFEGLGGGAIYISLDRSSNKPGIIDSCLFKENSTDFYGGAIRLNHFNDGTCYFEITNCVFDGNSGPEGGAIYVGAQGPTDATIIRDSKFYNNKSNRGGAIMGFGYVTVLNCSFSFNTANVGGAVATYVGNITNTVFFKNKSLSTGGALHTYYYGPEETTVLHCSFSENVALSSGGAISAEGYLIEKQPPFLLPHSQ